jgi:hypothetical protein
MTGLRCLYCGRRRPPCGFYPMAYIQCPDGAGQLCWDCDAWLGAGRPSRVMPTEEVAAPWVDLAQAGAYDG